MIKQVKVLALSSQDEESKSHIEIIRLDSNSIIIESREGNSVIATMIAQSDLKQLVRVLELMDE